MSLLDRLGKKAFDAIDAAVRIGERFIRPGDDLGSVPLPPPNVSPFAAPADAEADAEAPLAKPELPAQVFGRGTDPWTGRTLQLLADRDIEHEFVDLDGEGAVAIEARLVGLTGHPTPPYVFIRGEHIGGFNALSEIDRLGQLEQLVKSQEERAASTGPVQILVPKRGGDDTPQGERGNVDDRK